MRKFSLIIMLVVVLVLVLAACDDATSISGDAAKGEELYRATVIGKASAPGCITCHSLDEGTVLVGPSHAGIASNSVGVVAGLSAEEYLEQSIREPNAHITDGYTEGVMYPYGSDLSDQEIADMIAFLMTQ